MVAIPFADQNSTPAVQEPQLQVSVQSDSGGGLGGALGGVASLLESSGGPDPWLSHLIGLYINTGLATFVDKAVLKIVSGAEAPVVAVDDILELSLGFDDENKTVLLSGKVQHIENSLQGHKRLIVTGAGFDLVNTRINSSYEQQTAGDIINALLAETEVSTGNIESGVNYPFYVIDDRRNCYQHIHDICQQNNWLCYFSADGKLNCHEAVTSGDVAHSFVYGSNISDIQHWQQPVTVKGLKVVGSSAAASEGQDASAWLVKDPKAVSEIGDGPGTVTAKPSLKDVDGTQAFGERLLAVSQQQSNRVRIIAAAAQSITVGSLFDVAETPDGFADGTYIAQRVQNLFDPAQGFTSIIEGYNTEAGGSALGGLF